MVVQVRSAPRSGYERLTITDGHQTRYGRIELAGEVVDAEPILVRRIRVIDGIVISVVTDGVGEYRSVDGHTWRIASPNVTVVLPGEPHWYGTAPGERWTELFAIVSGPIFDTVITATDVRSGPRPLPAAARSQDLGVILKSHSHPASSETQVWALARWLADALQPPTDEQTDRWDEARQLLTEDLRHPVALDEIAGLVGLSYEAFRHQFRKRQGRAPLAYRNEYRLQSAATLLRLTSLSCRGIAERLGYTDEFHLSRRFKARFGVSPTQYRQQRASAS